MGVFSKPRPVSAYGTSDSSRPRSLPTNGEAGDEDDAPGITTATTTTTTSPLAYSPVPSPQLQQCWLLQLPMEITHYILTYLECQHLVSLSRTCRQLKHAADADILWLDLLRRRIPARDFPEELPYLSPNYRSLYISHHPYWFLPRHQIWISDESMTGKLILCKFDPRRGCIEGYRVVAERGLQEEYHWAYKPSVTIHTFSPHVRLWLDDPVLKLPYETTPTAQQGKLGWWENEIKMSVGRSGHSTAASFFLTRNIPEVYQAANMDLWPPRTIPGMPRVRAMSQDQFRGKGHKPQKHDEISQTAFRMRNWSQFFSGLAHVGVRLGEEVSTWSTLHRNLYTPTTDKPYQGIYVGDYSVHGCEFLLVMQTDKAPPPPLPSESSNRMQEMLAAVEAEMARTAASDEQAMALAGRVRSEPNVQNVNAHRGALEAIKLTGDPNVPRGEHTFIADDIGPNGFIRIASEPPFRGARVVKSRGHVAERGFLNDEFVPSQLIMIDQNRLAQYWIPFGHISFYERVNMDHLMATAC